MTRRELTLLQYKRMLEERRGHNYEYWGERHENLLQRGWQILEIERRGKLEEATKSEWLAQGKVTELRKSGHYARIVCGYEKNVQREKMFTVIFRKR